MVYFNIKAIKTLSDLIYLDTKRRIFKKKYFAEIDITDNCNLRCKHCYHFNGKDNFKTNEIPIEEWKKRFIELHKNGIRFLLMVGGEPALRKDVLMLADKIFDYTYVISNGTIKIPEEFRHPIFISLDGKQETNDSIRGKGVFSKVITNYSGDNRVIINITITKENYKELEDVIKIAKEHNFRGVVCNICMSTTNNKNKLSINSEERKPLIDELKRMKKAYPYDFLLTQSMIKWYEYANHAGFCYWGDEAIHYDVNWKKRRCFMKADCTNCGCFAGTYQNPLNLTKNPIIAMKFT